MVTKLLCQIVTWLLTTYLLFCSHIDSHANLISSISILGFWKSPPEPTHAFSFSGLQRTQELYHSNPNSIFSSSLNVGFNSKNEHSTPTNNHLYWPIRDTRTESYSASINKLPPERNKNPLLLAADCLVLS